MHFGEKITSDASTFYSTLKGALFLVHYREAPSLSVPKHRSLIRSFPFWCIIAIQSIQLLTLVLEYSALTPKYSDFSQLYTILDIVRPDTWSGDPSQFLYFSISLLASAVFSYIGELILVMNRPEDRLPQWVSMLSDTVFNLFRRVGLYPCVRVWIGQGLYGGGPREKVAGIVGVIAGAAVMAWRALFVGNNNWYIRGKSEFSRVTCDFELRELAVGLVLAGAGVVLPNTDPTFPCFLTFFLSLYLFYQLAFSLPYLNSSALHSKSAQYLILAWLSLCVLVGHATVSMLVTLSLFGFVSPCLALFSYYFVKHRTETWQKSEDCKTQWEFEIALRGLLMNYFQEKCTESAVKETIQMGVKRFGLEKRSHLLFAQYYFYIREESEYALLRLACANSCPSRFVSDFQVFHFFEKVSEITDSDERRYLDYIGYYRTAMKADFELCSASADLFTHLTRSNLNVSQTETMLKSLSYRIRSVQKAYSDVRIRFPTDPLMRTRYNSLATELFFEPQKANFYSSSASSKISRKNMTNEQVADYSAMDTGVFVISGHHGQFGKIVFANPRCAQILNCTVEEIEGRDLDDFLPPPFYVRHNSIMARFISAGEAREIFRTHLFLYAHGSYSVEVTFRFRPAGFLGVPYFLVAIKAKPHTREFALYDSEMKITSHSKRFPETINEPIRAIGTLNGLSLKELFPGIERKFEFGQTGKPVLYRHPESGVLYHLMFASTGLGSLPIRWMYVFTSESGMLRLIDSNAAYNEEMSFRPGMKDLEAIGRVDKKDSDIYSNDESDGKWLSNFAVSPLGLSLRRAVISSSRIALFSFLLGSFFSVALALANLLLFFAILDQFSASVSDSTVILAPAHLSKVAYLSREIDLSERVPFPGNVTESLIREITNLEQAAKSIMSEDQGERKVEMWERMGGKVSSREMGLASALRDFIMHASNYVAAYPCGAADDLFYVYRNGFGELLSAIQTHTQVSFQSNIEMLPMTLATSMLAGCVLALSLTCVSRSVMMLGSTYGRLWRALMNVGPKQLAGVVSAHQHRLASLHNLPPTFSPHIPINRHLSHPPSPHWVSILVLISVYTIATSCAFGLVTLYEYTEVTNLVAEMQGVTKSAGEVVGKPVFTTGLIKELALDVMTGKGYSHLTPEGQLYPDLSSTVSSSIESLLSTLDSVLLSLQHFSNFDLLAYYVVSLCSDPSIVIPDCQRTVFSLGLESAMHDYYFTISLSEALLIAEGSLPWETITRLETYTETLTEALLINYGHSVNNVDAEIAKFRLYMTLAFVGFCLSSVLLYVLLYRKEVGKLREKCLVLWRVSMLIPGTG